MLTRMWSTIHRARRRLARGEFAPPPIPAPGVDPAPPSLSRPVEDIVIVVGRPEVDRLRHALQSALGDGIEPPNTPDRIEAALACLLERAGAPGRPRVIRLPAGVSTPESWEIHLDGGDRASGLALRDAARTGRFVA
jgi:hypothetical protein